MKRFGAIIAGCLLVFMLVWITWRSRTDISSPLASNVKFWADASRQDPGDLKSKWMLARSYEEAGRPDRAEEIYRSILRVSPSNGSARIRLGYILCNRGDRKGARDLWKPVLLSPSAGLRKEAKEALARYP